MRRLLVVVSMSLSIGCTQAAPPRRPATMSAGALAMAPAEGGAAPSATDRRIAAAQHALQSSPDDLKGWTQLARLYVKKARETTDPGLYTQANDATERALQIAPADVAALELRGLLLLQDHRFVEARALGQQVVARAPADWTAFGIAGDAETELGRYDEAAASYQRMLDLHPDQASYSRASWLRWLHGDAAGAIEAMKLAVDAGSPRDIEGSAWCMAQLGQAHFLVGDLDRAAAAFDGALARLPGFAPALLGRGRVLAARGRLDDAIAALRTAVAANATVEARWALADTLARSGRDAEAAAAYVELERTGARLDPRTFALYLATRGRDVERAEELVRREQTTRDDIFTEDVLAWVLYRQGRLVEARAASDRALGLGTPDARLLYHAGAIRRALGDQKGAAALLARALAANPHFDENDANQARRWLTQRN